jgi:hypothetical protein
MYHPSVHDEVNLARLVRRLEKSVALDEWKNVEENRDTWLKAEGILQVSRMRHVCTRRLSYPA